MRVRPASKKTLIAGALAAILLAVGFTWLVAEVLAGHFQEFDRDARDTIHALSTPALTHVMVTVSTLGSAWALFPIGVLVVVLYLRRGNKHSAVLLIVAMAGALPIERGLKVAFQRPRPNPFFDYPIPNTYSLPSGHALFSVVFFGMLAALVSPALSSLWKKVLLWIVAAIPPVVIGFSRIYLGVHYATDVIAGYTAAVVWVLALVIGWSVTRRVQPT